VKGPVPNITKRADHSVNATPLYSPIPSDKDGQDEEEEEGGGKHKH